MAINLVKGQKINLNKEAGITLKKVRIALGWSENQFDSGKDFDLDASVFGLGANGKIVSEKFFVFYNNTTSPDGAIQHSGDNKTGAGDGDDESIVVDFEKIDPRVEKISVIVTIHEAKERGQNFGQVTNSYIRVLDEETGTEIAKFRLEDEASTNAAVQFGELQKRDGTWMFAAAGNGYDKGLADFVRLYGGDV